MLAGDAPPLHESLAVMPNGDARPHPEAPFELKVGSVVKLPEPFVDGVVLGRVTRPRSAGDANQYLVAHAYGRHVFRRSEMEIIAP